MLFLSLVFGCTMIFTLVVFTLLTRVLKTNFPSYYKQEKSFLRTMTSILVLSILVRLIILGVRYYIDNFPWYSHLFEIPGPEFNMSSFTYFMTLDGSNAWIPPLYFGLHFFFINFISQGILLFNFGFALSNKKRVMNTNRKQTTNLMKRTRRETFLRMAVGNGNSDDDDDDVEDEENYYSGFKMSTGGQDHSLAAQNPFKMSRGLRDHLDRSPNATVLDRSFEGEDEEDGGGSGMFSVFHRVTKNRKSSYNKQRGNTAIVSSTN